MTKNQLAAGQLVDLTTARPNWARAGLKLIPYIGESLDELIYGRADEARWRRMEQTLGELGELMEQRQIPPGEIGKEQFGDLLEVVAPAVSRATTEEKRRFLRDLLLNAVTLPVGSNDWEAARMAATIIAELGNPDIAILAALDRIGARGEAKAELRAVVGSRGGELMLTDPPGESVLLPFEWLVIEQAYRRVSAAPTRLVIAGAHGDNRLTHLALTALGEFVIEWAKADGRPSRATPNGVV